MKIDEREKQLLKVAMAAILFYFALLRTDVIFAIGAKVLEVAKPFLIGGAMAFVINVPMKKIEALLKNTKLKKGHRGIALIFTLLLLLLFISCFLLIVVPQLSQAVTKLVIRLQQLAETIPQLIENNSHKLSILEQAIVALEIDWRSMGQNFINYLQNFAKDLVNSSTSVISGVVSGFTTFLLSFIFSIYLVTGKEKIKTALSELTAVLLPDRENKRLTHIITLADSIFSSFLSGQCLEALVLGAMFVVIMSLFRLPYAFLIGIIIGVTALIPVMGAFIGCAVGFVLILLESPVQAIWFLVLFLILQQIEGNIIYPRVVGGTIGLPSVLVFMSVIIGGELMGVVGMLLFIPSVSVVYTLLKEFVAERRRQPETKTE